jgi:tetratricopeptide (TPR) repeat protein
MKKLFTGLLTLFIFLILLPHASPSFPAGQSRKSAQQVTVEIDRLVRLATSYQNTSPKESLKLAARALTLSRQFNNLKGEVESLRLLCTVYFFQGAPAKALEYCNQLIGVLKRVNDQPELARLYQFMGFIYNSSRRYTTAIEYLQKSLNIRRRVGDKKEIAAALGRLGPIYLNVSKWDTALKCNLEALSLLEEVGNKNDVAEVLFVTGVCYQHLRQNKKAKEVLERAARYKRELGDRKTLGSILDSLGTVHTHLKDWDKAADLYTEALTFRQAAGDKHGTAFTLYNLGMLHYNLKHYDMGLDFHNRSLKLRLELGHHEMTAFSYLGIAYIYTDQKKFQPAKEYLDKSYDLAKEIAWADQLKSRVNGGYYMLYKEMGDYKNALRFYKSYARLEQKKLSTTTMLQATRWQAGFEADKRERDISALEKDKILKLKENEVLKKDNQIRQLRLERTKVIRNAFITGFALVSIILVLVFQKYLYLFAFWKKQKYIGKFRLMDKLGCGAMGTVYKAHSVVNKKELAAVKILKEEFLKDENSIRRFKREAAVIDKLDHPNIIRIFERGQAGQSLFIAMEFLAGKNLALLLTEEEQIAIDRCLHIMVQVTEALVFIHSQNIVHRDLKPDNIMVLERDGDKDFVKLLDFGLAKMELETRLTQTGNFVGTLEYMSPELLLNGNSSSANDIFSLGVTFYHLLCNRSPFPGESPVDIMREIIRSTPAAPYLFRLDIPMPLDGLVMQMIDKRPQQRPAADSVLTVLKDLDNASSQSRGTVR